MPITPYHFGPSGFVGLLFRKWIDIPVFVLANVVVDVEVLLIWFLDLGWPRHRYCHTLLVGAAVGAAWGLTAYPLRHFFRRLMQIFRMPYQTGFGKMVVSGILGAWCHVIIDAIYHRDVQMFWPSSRAPLYGLISKQQVETMCLIFFIPAIILYVIAAVSYAKSKSAHQGKVETGRPDNLASR